MPRGIQNQHILCGGHRGSPVWNRPVTLCAPRTGHSVVEPCECRGQAIPNATPATRKQRQQLIRGSGQLPCPLPAEPPLEGGILALPSSGSSPFSGACMGGGFASPSLSSTAPALALHPSPSSGRRHPKPVLFIGGVPLQK